MPEVSLNIVYSSTQWHYRGCTAAHSYVPLSVKGALQPKFARCIFGCIIWSIHIAVVSKVAPPYQAFERYRGPVQQETAHYPSQGHHPPGNLAAVAERAQVGHISGIVVMPFCLP